MDIFRWIHQILHPQSCTSEAFIYDDMDSQSGRSLPILYHPFNAGDQGHWQDRGAVWDYLLATQVEVGRLLDFGPGDGWPSLILAPFVREVVGVDGSQRRVQVCQENAARLGISNATFVYVSPGTRLPFEDHSFDAVTAASSIEQTPDPRFTLRELFRVLRPGGCLRIGYEALGGYRGGQERDTWLCRLDEQRCKFILFDRHIDEERVVQYALSVAMPCAELRRVFGAHGRSIPFNAVTVSRLEQIRTAISGAQVCTTYHPSGRTLLTWLKEIGFREAKPTHNGIQFAGELFEQLAGGERPNSLEAIDAYLWPIIKRIVECPSQSN